MSSSKPESIIRWTARIRTMASLLFLSAFIFSDAEGSGKLYAGPRFALIAAPGFLFVLASLFTRPRPATTDSHASARVQDGHFLV